MCLHAVSSCTDIDHLYMKSGHSQMIDSVHSTIENACRKQDIYCPTDYYRIVRMARHGEDTAQYEVIMMDTDMFNDYKKLSANLIQNRTKDDTESTVNWLKIKWMRYEKTNANKIFFKYVFDEEFRVMCIETKQNQTSGKRQRDRKGTKLQRNKVPCPNCRNCLLRTQFLQYLWLNTAICCQCASRSPFSQTITLSIRV
jgi:hypothetical protein